MKHTFYLILVTLLTSCVSSKVSEKEIHLDNLADSKAFADSLRADEVNPVVRFTYSCTHCKNWQKRSTTYVYWKNGDSYQLRKFNDLCKFKAVYISKLPFDDLDLVIEHLQSQIAPRGLYRSAATQIQINVTTKQNSFSLKLEEEDREFKTNKPYFDFIDKLKAHLFYYQDYPWDEFDCKLYKTEKRIKN